MTTNIPTKPHNYAELPTKVWTLVIMVVYIPLNYLDHTRHNSDLSHCGLKLSNLLLDPSSTHNSIKNVIMTFKLLIDKH